MGQRSDLQNTLETLLGSNRVYFQPPADLRMEYPAIVYQRDDVDIRFANNLPYKHEKRYQITIISKDVDSDIPNRIATLPKCVFNRFFIANNLNHDVYTVYF